MFFNVISFADLPLLVSLFNGLFQFQVLTAVFPRSLTVRYTSSVTEMGIIFRGLAAENVEFYTVLGVMYISVLSE